MSVKHCGNCQNFVANREGESSPVCSKGHEPTFKMPRSPVDLDYGYRRNCNDFKQRQEASPHETIVNCLWVPIMWVNDNPVLDGAKYFNTKEEALEFIDSHKIKSSNVVQWTIPRIEKGN